MKKIYRRPVLTKARQYPNELNFPSQISEQNNPLWGGFFESPQGEKGEVAVPAEKVAKQADQVSYEFEKITLVEQDEPGCEIPDTGTKEKRSDDE